MLLRLQGIRRGIAALLERRVDDRELITKVYNELLTFRSDAREEMRELKSVIRRLDAPAPPE